MKKKNSSQHTPHASPMREDSRIYVAGHRGLVGSSILRKLQELGYNPEFITIQPRKNCSSKPGLPHESPFITLYAPQAPRSKCTAALRNRLEIWILVDLRCESIALRKGVLMGCCSTLYDNSNHYYLP